MKDVLTIAEVAERSGVATSAPRFFEDEELIQSQRTDAGHRRYRGPSFAALPLSCSHKRLG